jgi:hypothetical protein
LYQFTDAPRKISHIGNRWRATIFRQGSIGISLGYFQLNQLYLPFKESLQLHLGQEREMKVEQNKKK